jgi:hypothetical protein
MVLTVSFALSPVIGLSCHRHPRDAKHHREFDASVEASGPHDFAVRVSAVRYRHLRVHRIPSRVRDDREPPLMWDGTEKNKPVIWVWCEEGIFLRRGWTGNRKIARQGKSVGEVGEARMSGAICGTCVSFAPGYRFAHPGYGCGIAFRHCEERSDEAIQFFL